MWVSFPVWGGGGGGEDENIVKPIVSRVSFAVNDHSPGLTSVSSLALRVKFYYIQLWFSLKITLARVYDIDACAISWLNHAVRGWIQAPLKSSLLVK